MNEMSILLVEDNDDDRYLTTRLFRKMPFAVRIDIAKNGDEALKMILGNESSPPLLPAIVLLDLQLPKIGGITLLTRIREKFSARQLPVVVLSSSDNPGDIALCKELGINGYISKPLDRSSLEVILRIIAPTLHTA